MYFLASKIELAKLITSLKFSPSDEQKNRLNKIIASCKIDPQHVELRYAFCYNNIALAARNMVILDPVLWSEIAGDPEAVKVTDIFEKFIEPNLTTNQKNYLRSTKNLLTPAVQDFIFKHELGHVVQQFSRKKLLVNSLVGFGAAFCGIFAAHLSYQHLSGVAAILIGATAGWMGDALFTLFSNIMFKLYKEKTADSFAAKYSSLDEIIAAAEFFEKHQDVVAKSPWIKGFLSKLPSILTSGHLNGRTRKEFLLEIAQQK